METNWAAEHLQVIRTLMERSALYRRALAPIMLVSGIMGVAGAVASHWMPEATVRGFALHWLVVSLFAFTAALLLVRRQALKAAEPFWSLPTQRVAIGLFPSFFTGLILAGAAVLEPSLLPAWLLSAIWMLCYGNALHAAGFFMPRGIRLFGTAFLAGGALLLAGASTCPWLREPGAGHYIMGTAFGALHLVYGIYLYFTERRQAK